MNNIVTFSHLRWDFVYQRPQHLLTRLAKRYAVTYIEEPKCVEDCSPHLHVRFPADRLTVITPVTPCSSPGFHDDQMPLIRPLIRNWLRESHSFGEIAWLYTPMALPLIYDMGPGLTVYDCMDELSKFRFAPESLTLLERELLELADVVFTGGPSLYNFKKQMHPNVHCFPSSVDAEHFGRARFSQCDPPDQVQIPHPRLGFFGVIDERLDLELLRSLAEMRPSWQFVMVGPVVKIDEQVLPRNPNIHYLGSKDYSQLPDYLAGWDVCLLPFALNDSTEFISPTKTLEYMAAERQIVSTPITDVAQPYGHIVYLGSNPREFVLACERALHAHANDRMVRIENMRQILAGTSWDRTARSMDLRMREVLRQRRALVNPVAVRSNGHNRASNAS